MLEPAYNAGGDTFDYSVDREYLYASITDAMGHATEAAMLATFTVGTLRNSRRALASPAQQADAANAGLMGNARADQFVTGLLIRIRLADGQAEVVNAGHPQPYLMRAGRLIDLDLTTGLPFGVLAAPYTAQALTLHPGDRLLLVTDGYLDRNASGVDIEGILVASAERHPRQLVQELANNVLKATGGNLRDDATVVCIDWYGPGGTRDATGGPAEPARPRRSPASVPLRCVRPHALARSGHATTLRTGHDLMAVMQVLAPRRDALTIRRALYSDLAVALVRIVEGGRGSTRTASARERLVGADARSWRVTRRSGTRGRGS